MIRKAHGIRIFVLLLSFSSLFIAIPLLADYSLSIDNRCDEEIEVTPLVGTTAYPGILVAAQTVVFGQTPQQVTAVSINEQSILAGEIATLPLSSSISIIVDFSDPAQIILINIDEYR